jgi:hypothetical protein
MSWREFLRARPDDSIGREGRAPINIDPGPSATTAGTGEAPVPIQEALRSLNNPAALGNCALAGILPRTIRAFGPELSDPRLAGTSLFRARALRSALVAGIETLRTSGGEGLPEAESLRYTILHEEYVLGRPNTQIMVRHSISESTFHRYRREAARLLGQELARQEEMLGVESPPGLGGGDD